MDGRRVLVLDTDDVRRAATCAMLERAGYITVGASKVHSLEPYLDDPIPTVLLYDVSVPRSWREVLEEHAVLRAIVDDRCAIVLYGERPEGEFSELEWATRATAHIPAHPEGRYVLALLKRLLPPPPPPPPSRTTRPPSLPGTARPNAPAIKMLLIDDSEMTLELMQSMLASVGFDVRIAVALGEVRSIVANWAPNVIVADVKRPDIRGDELCARLKASVHRSDVMVLLCSSLPERELGELARAAHADGWVSKSQGLERFVEQLGALTRKLVDGEPASQRTTEAR